MEGGSFCTPDLLGDTYILGKITQEHVLCVNLSSFAWQLLTLGPLFLFCSLQVYVNKGVFGSRVTRHVATRPNELFWSKDHLVYGQTRSFLLFLFFLFLPQFFNHLIYRCAACKIQQLSVEGFIVFQRGDGGFRDRGFGWAIAALPKLLIVCSGKYQSSPLFVLRNSADVS